MDKKKSKYTYFASNGDYGDVDLRNDWTDLVQRYRPKGVSLTATVTEHWTDVMWEAIKNAPPKQRSEMANHISVGIHLTNNTDVCKWCGISKDLLEYKGRTSYAPPASKPKPSKPIDYKPVSYLEPIVLNEGLKDVLNGAVDHVKEVHADEIKSTLDQINKEG